MKAARLTSPQTFEMVEVETPAVEEGAVLIKVQASSICGSDIHGIYHGQVPEEDYPLPPGRPCHEVAGVVVESKTDEINVGQRVVVLPGRTSGGLQEYIVQTPDRVLPVPDWGPIEEWVMCQHSGTVLYSTMKWGNPAGKSIGVLGQGGIGLSFTMLAAAQGADRVIGIDLVDARLRKSREMGASDTINPDEVNLVEAVDELTDGQGLDYVIDASGAPEGLNTVVSIVRRHGTIINFSLLGGRSIEFNHAAWMRKAATIIPTQVAGTDRPTDTIRQMIRMKERHYVDPGQLVSHRVGFEVSDIQAAYDMYSDHSDGVIKVVMQMD
ncbi:MAG: zinc-binding dehydrogenase [Chloroflexi bacterium]|nr:zinc-binding dehydrogenase [Chloroflexota bacterium]MCH8818065.1 zinc-binding dehydrogenase [Chloroflexota bacterium]